MNEELQFLRYFYDAVSSALGPADGDVYHAIKQEFLDNNGYLPVGYFLYEDE